MSAFFEKTTRLFPLSANQALAADPDESVWLSASAGTGKTQVLSARVLRLLLAGVRPDQILCLTFTKAGAAEMAGRINATLASWVRMEETQLFRDLAAISADETPGAIAHARTLFASVLDCPGGGLRIDTIHAFAQWLLAAFPEEAQLVPGTRPMEDRERMLLSRQVLAQLLIDAEAQGDAPLLATISALSMRMGAESVQKFLMQCADARDAWFGTGSWMPPFDARVRQLLGLPSDADAAWCAQMCDDAAFDVASLRGSLAIYAQWSAATSEKTSYAITEWLAADNVTRLGLIPSLYKLLITAEGTVKNLKSLEKIDPSIKDYIGRIHDGFIYIQSCQSLLTLAEWLAPALEVGRKFALAWDEAKAREGLIDFDDQIRCAADLLDNSDMADWIRYKLDRQFDHILVDEAQDTNQSQWQIIKALTDDFFTGSGARDDRRRTLFVVGDYKQAIFGFQGTSPENFAEAKGYFHAKMQGAADAAAMLHDAPDTRPLRSLGLGQSYRTAAPVLEYVDLAIAQIGFEAIGLDQIPEPHLGEVRPGYVALWQAVGGKQEAGADDEKENSDSDEAENSWLPKPERDLADAIARQVKHWIDSGFPLAKDGARRATAGDVMILVRKRGDLAALIVARLAAAGVDVAGVDRLRLGAPLAVRDLMAALRFAAQPLDDLNLAELLVSPLIGWSQNQLLDHGYREKGVALWSHLRRSSHADVAELMVQLTALLAKADYESVQALLHWILVGPWQGQARLVGRLGHEAQDPIAELLNAANGFAATLTPSLAGFLAWFDAGEGELKREAEAAGDKVRVMTVHGAKGLQAPIVILADATVNPERSPARKLELVDPASEIGAEITGNHRLVPLPNLRNDEKLGLVAEAADANKQAEMQEHWRLLYVAMTRAEEALFITGALKKSETAPHDNSWYARLLAIFGDAAPADDRIWGQCWEWGALPPLPPKIAETIALPMPEAKPGWLTRPPYAEPRPAKPLAPSALGEDLSSDAPVAAGADAATLAAAARRGLLIHRLLERLPAVPDAQRADAAARWLGRQAADVPQALREEMATSALTVIADPRFSELFTPDALAEVPITAKLGTRIIAGTIDRLLIEPTRIRLVDFKTARYVPAGVDFVPKALLRQMAAYAAGLAAIYPDRRIDVALLYTHAPRLIAIPAHILEQHKLALLAEE